MENKDKYAITERSPLIYYRSTIDGGEHSAELRVSMKGPTPSTKNSRQPEAPLPLAMPSWKVKEAGGNANDNQE
jgi:hypothetical protein